MDKNIRKLKILYKCQKANTSAMWQHMLTYHQLKYASPNRSDRTFAVDWAYILTVQTKLKQKPHKEATFRKMEV